MSKIRKLAFSDMVLGGILVLLAIYIFFFGQNAKVIGAAFTALIGAGQFFGGYLYYIAPPRKG